MSSRQKICDRRVNIFDVDAERSLPYVAREDRYEKAERNLDMKCCMRRTRESCVRRDTQTDKRECMWKRIDPDDPILAYDADKGKRRPPDRWTVACFNRDTRAKTRRKDIRKHLEDSCVPRINGFEADATGSLPLVRRSDQKKFYKYGKAERKLDLECCMRRTADTCEPEGRPDKCRWDYDNEGCFNNRRSDATAKTRRKHLLKFGDPSKTPALQPHPKRLPPEERKRREKRALYDAAAKLDDTLHNRRTMPDKHDQDGGPRILNMTEYERYIRTRAKALRAKDINAHQAQQLLNEAAATRDRDAAIIARRRYNEGKEVEGEELPAENDDDDYEDGTYEKVNYDDYEGKDDDYEGKYDDYEGKYDDDDEGY